MLSVCIHFVTTYEFNDEIMKMEHLNKTFHMKKLSMNLTVMKHEKRIFNFKINTVIITYKYQFYT
jgi:hypothetical protein